MNIKRKFIMAAVAVLALVAAKQQGLFSSETDTQATVEVINAQKGDIAIADGYVRTNGATATSGAAFFTIVNSGSADDRLIGASTTIANMTELHGHIEQDGVMLMRPLEDGVAVESKGHASLARGGSHVMLMGLSEPVAEGANVSITLTFEQGGDIVVDLPVDSKRVVTQH